MNERQKLVILCFKRTNREQIQNLKPGFDEFINFEMR